MPPVGDLVGDDLRILSAVLVGGALDVLADPLSPCLGALVEIGPFLDGGIESVSPLRILVPVVRVDEVGGSMERRDGHALGRCAGGGVDDRRVLGAGAAGPQARHRSDGGDEIGSGAGVGGGHAAAAGEAGEIDALGVDAALSGELLNDCGQEGDVVASAPGRGLSGDGGSARNAPRPVPVRQRTAGVHGGGGRRPRHDETGLVGVGDGVQLGDAGLEDAVRIRVVQVHDQGQRGLGVGRLGNVHLHGVGGSVEVDVDALSAAERAAALRRGRGGLRGRGVVRLRGRGSGARRRVGAGCERRGARGCALQE